MAKQARSEGELNAQQNRFVQEYIIDLNGTKAATRAGYAAKSAGVTASQLLKIPKIKAAVTEAEHARSLRTGITADRVLAEFAKIGFSNMLDYLTVQPSGDAVIDLSAVTRDQGAAIAEFTSEEYTDGRGDEARQVKQVKLKLADKKTALTKMGEHLGLWNGQDDGAGKVINITISPQLAKL